MKRANSSLEGQFAFFKFFKSFWVDVATGASFSIPFLCFFSVERVYVWKGVRTQKVRLCLWREVRAFPHSTYLQCGRQGLLLTPGASQVGLVVNNLPANAGNAGLTSRSGRPFGGGNSNPLKYSCLGESHRQRSLVGYSCKELDMTECLHTLTLDALIWHGRSFRNRSVFAVEALLPVRMLLELSTFWLT